VAGKNVSQEQSRSDEKQLTGWEKVGILLSGIGTPMTVALLGLLVSSYLNRQQAEDTNTRAFAELISSREAADTNLRKEMFTTVLDKFFKSGSDASTVDDRILKLEILAYNFHESLDLAPMFQDVLRQIKIPDGTQQLDRLTKVAKDVVFKQVEALTTDIGLGRMETVDFERLARNPGGYVIIDDNFRLRPSSLETETDHLPRKFQVEVLSSDPARKELRVRMRVSRPGQLTFEPSAEVDVWFTLGFFDFPSIDNTRLSHGERCAVVLEDMEEDHAQIELVFFPANRAGLKDSMYVEEFMREMLKIRTQK
jgi:hypothetical protein